MKKKIGFAVAAILTIVALQWAVASVDTQPAATQSVVSGTTQVNAEGKVCPKEGTAACPKGEATATSTSAACPKDKAGCDKAASASCPKGEATATSASAACPKGEAAATSTSAKEVDCTKAEGAKCPYSGAAKS
jgi:hypothetical protein